MRRLENWGPWDPEGAAGRREAVSGTKKKATPGLFNLVKRLRMKVKW